MMLGRIRGWLTGRREQVPARHEFPAIARDEVAALWHRPDGLPRVDWHLASHWISRQGNSTWTVDEWRRAVMGACLDEVRDSLDRDHRRWSSLNVEGLAPVGGIVADAMRRVAERSFTELRRTLKVVRDDAPIPPIALVAVEPMDAYIDFTNSYFPDGAFATSGGLYLNEGPDSFPLIAVNAQSRHGCEATVAHELTHHALHGLRLPLWVEEGFTQMMEERIVGTPNFQLNRDMVERQRALWDYHDIEFFLEGEAFLSPENGVQELAYHLSQWVVRQQLSEHPQQFFQFVRACRMGDPDGACQQILGVPTRDLVLRTIGVDD